MNRSVSIAFRSYLAPLASTRAVRISLLVALAFLGVVAVGVAARFIPRDALVPIGQLVIMPGLPLFAIILSEMAIRDGITQRTLLYPLLGPVSRPVLATVRTLATGLLLTLGILCLVIATRLLDPARFTISVREVLTIVLASFTYTALAGVVHLLTRRGLVTLLAILAVELQIGRIPFGLRAVVPSFHVRVLADHLDTFSLPIPIDMPDPAVTDSLFYLILVGIAATFAVAAVFANKNLGELC